MDEEMVLARKAAAGDAAAFTRLVRACRRATAWRTKSPCRGGLVARFFISVFASS